MGDGPKLAPDLVELLARRYAGERHDHGIACPCGACAPQTAAMRDLDTDPDAAEREAREWWEERGPRFVHPVTRDQTVASLAALLRAWRDRGIEEGRSASASVIAALLRAAEERGRLRGLEEAARECEAERGEYPSSCDEARDTAWACAARIRARCGT